jgi:uncharacterized Zn-finger protein
MLAVQSEDAQADSRREREKSHLCSDCGKAFSRRQSLKRHTDQCNRITYFQNFKTENEIWRV